MPEKLMAVEEAVGIIPDGATVACSGFGAAGHPEILVAAIEERFLAEGRPRDLTLMFASGQGDVEGRGLDHLAHPGLVKRVIGGHFGLTPKLAKLAAEGGVEAYNWPSGVISRLYRAIAAQEPGVLTPIGLKTFVDPRLDGGKVSATAAPDLVDLLVIREREYLLYHTFPVSVALIRATTADELGNLTMENEACVGEALAMAQAARNSGGVVLAEVAHVALGGSLDPRLVRVPGMLVDGVVLASSARHLHTCGVPDNPSYWGALKVPLPTPPTHRLRARKVLARRATMELSAGLTINIGADILEDMLAVLYEEGMRDRVVIALESGVIGGLPAVGPLHGAAWNPHAILDQPSQFDFIDGGGLDAAVLYVGQIDSRGNANASRFGGRLIGCGAFIDISQGARQVILCGLFTENAEIAVLDNQVALMREGERPMFVEAVDHVTFSGEYATQRGQRVLYVTERAVFELRAGKLTLTEIAPGMDLKRDVLARMDFRPEIDADLKRMDSALFSRDPMGLSSLP